MSNNRPESELAGELASMAARAPAHIAARIAAAVNEITASGTAQGLMVGDRASRDGGAVSAGITTLILPPGSHDEPRGLELVLRLVE